MVAKLDLLALQNIVSAGGYDGLRNISNGTGAMLLSSLDILRNYYHWQGSGYTLTDSEIDEINSLIDTAQDELIAPAGSSNVLDLLASNQYLTDTPDITLEWPITYDYPVIKVIVSGLRTNHTEWFDGLAIRFNDSSSPDAYQTNSFVMYGATHSQWTHYHQYGHWRHWICCYGAAASPLLMFGLSFDIHNNNTGSVYKQLHSNYSINHDGINPSFSYLVGGSFDVTTPIYKINIAPLTGTLFTVSDSPPAQLLDIRAYGYGV